MGTLIVLGLFLWGCYWAFRVGKRSGSRLGFNAGRYHRMSRSG